MSPLRRLIYLLPAFLPLFTQAHAGSPDGLKLSVVKIFTTARTPNQYEPWRVGPDIKMSGSGCILSGNRILTNAHVVSNQIFVQVLKRGDTHKYTAKVLAVAHDCDLALLKVEDPHFFKGTKPVFFGDLPFQGDKVEVYGYPVGGEELSITDGVVSRIEVIVYAHSLRHLPAVQTQAPINPGNSGGPVFKKGKMVGLAFQGYNAVVAQNTNYFIPTLLIKRFLKEVQKGSYHEVPAMGIYTQVNMDNPALRSYYGMKKNQEGLLVTKVTYGSSAWDEIKENDVLLSCDGYPVGNDGNIPFRKGEKINFQYALCLHHIGDRMKVKILRDKKVKNLSIRLKGDVRLVPLPRYDRKPSYFIFDGVIFSELDADSYRVIRDQDPSLAVLYGSGLPSPERKRVVLVNHIIPHLINKGYGSEYSSLVVQKINGITISELKDVIRAFEKPLDGRHVIEFDRAKEVGTRIVLKADGSKEATEEILRQNNIPSDRSADLKKGTP